MENPKFTTEEPSCTGSALNALLSQNNISPEEYSFMDFLGYELVEVGYFSGDDETAWQLENKYWMDEQGIGEVGCYYVNTKEDKWEHVEDVNFMERWDQLMDVIKGLHRLKIMPSFEPEAKEMIRRCFSIIEGRKG